MNQQTYQLPPRPRTHYHLEGRYQNLPSWRTSAGCHHCAIGELLKLIAVGKRKGLTVKERTYRNETTIWNPIWGSNVSIHQTYTYTNGRAEWEGQQSAHYVMDTCNMYSCAEDRPNHQSFRAYLAECEEEGLLMDTQSVAVLEG